VIIRIFFVSLVVAPAFCFPTSALVAAVDDAPIFPTTFRWKCPAPVQAPETRTNDRCFSVKDPTIVRHGDRWHLFTTIRSEKRTHQIEYSSFSDWRDADAAPRHILTFNPGYFCAPQVFYFAPQRKWYLLHQASDSTRPVALQPAFVTSETIDRPDAWSAPVFLFDKHPENVKAWIDFWIICDDAKAHLFFTSNNGLMWRAETTLAQFPRGWSQPVIVLRDDIFEASHTYRVRGPQRLFLTIVEAQDGLRRYYKAYVADRLDGEWKPLAATKERPFASAANVDFAGEPWAQSISHGELIRAGFDDKMEIDPHHLQFFFQGARDEQMRGVPYGQIPWRLGLLDVAKPAP
jgi:hypothetical protein